MAGNKFLKKSVFTFLTVLAGVGLFGSQEAQGQNLEDNLKTTMQSDTVFSEGTFRVRNAITMDNIPGANLHLRSLVLPINNPNIEEDYVMDANGQAPFELPVYIDTITSIQDFVRDQTHVFPNLGSEVNAYFPKVLEGTISFYDMNYNLVETQKFNDDHTYANLSKLSNGPYVYHITTKGRITITTKLLTDKISISIKDTGSGISKELQSKIFDPFYTSKPVGKGTGMGLFIVYGLVQENHGSIDLISEPGVGSEFIIKIPIT
ncbi:sensor histidine kinase [Lentimicrobium sp. S6]|uniref:sensor histidine kinase n=1 Tax=Lentimicrobium sp. S6 TaxID=2735872 RepID=UPI001555DD79|nr:ATP-binding protein [Lentimicrobium sp. S6]NPD47750.1 hypothetical protein [Lentimicrobium sp. S6]